MDETRVVLAHGGGGAMTRALVEELLLPALAQPSIPMTDAAPISGTDDLVFTTDAFVVKPLFFRGGDIGSLSVHGTVNDLAVSGARPLALTWAVIIEEGLELEVIRRVAESAGHAATSCGIQIVAGDTKVVSHGEADQLYVVTSGVGRRHASMAAEAAQPGDVLLISGAIAEHGIAILSERAGIQFETSVQSDSASVWPLVSALIEAGVTPRVMRDPTRGGLAACCNELATDARVTFALDERAIPVRPAVRAACEMLGLDPLTIANEGKLFACVRTSDAGKALEALRRVPEGREAVVIGEVTEQRSVPVFMRTRCGGERIVDMPYGEETPRIC